MLQVFDMFSDDFSYSSVKCFRFDSTWYCCNAFWIHIKYVFLTNIILFNMKFFIILHTFL